MRGIQEPGQGVRALGSGMSSYSPSSYQARGGGR
jgi:hypothetical protein